MSVATPRPGTWGTACAWLVLALWFCVAISSCSLRNTAADASSFADVGGETGVEVAADGLDSFDVSPAEVQDSPTAEIVDAVADDADTSIDAGDAITDAGSDDGEGLVDAEVGDATETELADSGEVMDAITDAVTDAVVADDGVGVDLVAVDIPIAEATPAVDTAVPCSATEVPAALTGTVEFDFSPLVPNPVVMGCGKGAPKPVKEGTPGCCKCAPPYSCYCNGECGWLRAPDLVKPQHDGQAVWTGKWVVSLGEAYQKYTKPFTTQVMPGDMNLQKWQPGSGKGFEIVKLPSPDFPAGHAVLHVLGSQVVVGVRYYGYGDGAFGSSNPIYLYDPETNVFTKVAMPFCTKLMPSGGTLVCTVGGDSYVKGDNPGLQVYQMASGKWELAQPPAALVPKDWYVQAPDHVVADANAVYLVHALRSMSPWPDGTNSYPAGPGHILKYEVKTQVWSDIGLLPVALKGEKGWFVRSMDHVGIVLLKDSIQAARFRLDTLKWEIGPEFASWLFGQQAPLLTPCGLLFASAHVGYGGLGGGMSHRPILLRPDLTWEALAPWGYPDDAATSRKVPNSVITDKEVLALGGMDGPPEGNFVYHIDSYRFPLSALCSNGGTKK